MSLLNKLIRELPDEISFDVGGLTFVFKQVKDASLIWQIREKALDVKRDWEKGLLKTLWGDDTPSHGDLAMLCAMLEEFCVSVSDGEITQKPTAAEFAKLAKMDAPRFSEVAIMFQEKTGVGDLAKNEYDEILTEKKI